MPAEVEVAAVVPMPAVAPEAGVHVPDAQVTVHVNVPAMKVMDPVRKVNPVAPVDPVGSMHAVRDVGAMHARTATADAVMAAAALRARISSAGRESCNADHGRRDESEKSRMFEHGRRPFWLDVGHPNIGRSIRASGSSD
jgi:hypothetical protein